MRKVLLLLAVLAVPVAPEVARAATPSEGVPLSVRRGFFTDLGGFGIFDLLGADGYSNLQIYLQLGVGYSIPIQVTKNGSLIDIGFHVGIGSNSANCYEVRRVPGDSTSDCLSSIDHKTVVADNFTLTFLNASVAVLFGIAERVYLGPKIVGGYTLIDPAPDAAGSRGGGTVGGGVSLEYATQMDHFSIGLEVTARYIIGVNILSLPFYVRLKYTF